jgi:hypothetical protein
LKYQLNGIEILLKMADIMKKEQEKETLIKQIQLEETTQIELSIQKEKSWKENIKEFSSIFKKQSLPKLADKEITSERHTMKKERRNYISGMISTIRKIIIQNFHSRPSLKEDKYVQHNKNLIKKKIDYMGSDKVPPIEKI